MATHKRGSRIISGAILAIGLVIVAAVLFSGMQDRERAVEMVALGDDSTQVATLLGPPPIRCPRGNLSHLGAQFPPATPRVTAETDLARLQVETASRWVYPGTRQVPSCEPDAGATEIGWSVNGRVLWYVPVHGEQPLVYDPNP